MTNEEKQKLLEHLEKEVKKMQENVKKALTVLIYLKEHSTGDA